MRKKQKKPFPIPQRNNQESSEQKPQTNCCGKESEGETCVKDHIERIHDGKIPQKDVTIEAKIDFKVNQQMNI